jgi:pimeloyl-ACP methyl ester carboxylesterase
LDRIAEAFARNFRVLAPDLRGHGDSSWTSAAAYTLPNFRVIDVPEAGHWVHHDQPEIFIEDTRKFLLG